MKYLKRFESVSDQDVVSIVNDLLTDLIDDFPDCHVFNDFTPTMKYGYRLDLDPYASLTGSEWEALSDNILIEFYYKVEDGIDKNSFFEYCKNNIAGRLRKMGYSVGESEYPIHHYYTISRMGEFLHFTLNTQDDIRGYKVRKARHGGNMIESSYGKYTITISY